MTNETELYRVALELYWEQGLKFTMDELSERLMISKKTLYEMVHSKEDLVTKVIEHYFELLSIEQDSIHSNTSLSTVERLEQLLCAIPAFQIKEYHLKELKTTYPNAFAVLDEKLSKGWERTFSVINMAKAEGSIKDIDNELFSKIYAAAIEGFLTENYIDSELSFRDKQKQLVNILLFGICEKEKSI